MQYYFYGNGDSIAYYYNYQSTNANNNIIFIHGLKSDITGSKAQEFKKFALDNNYNYLCFDLYGHGQSSGNFSDGTLTRWLENILIMIDNVANGTQIIIGSSLGGWLALLAAKLRPKRIKGLIGIASAPDFTENLIWKTLSDQDKSNLISGQIVTICKDEWSEGYPIKISLIDDGRKHLLLNDKIDINCPVRLFHSLDDTHVPCEKSLSVAKLLTSNDVELTMLKNSGHSMSDADSMNKFYAAIKNLS